MHDTSASAPALSCSLLYCAARPFTLLLLRLGACEHSTSEGNGGIGNARALITSTYDMSYTQAVLVFTVYDN